MTSRRRLSSKKAKSKPPSAACNPWSAPAKPSTSPPTPRTSSATKATAQPASSASVPPPEWTNSSLSWASQSPSAPLRLQNSTTKPKPSSEPKPNPWPPNTRPNSCHTPETPTALDPHSSRTVLSVPLTNVANVATVRHVCRKNRQTNQQRNLPSSFLADLFTSLLRICSKTCIFVFNTLHTLLKSQFALSLVFS